jgi:putative sigma-54 modulation protein
MNSDFFLQVKERRAENLKKHWRFPMKITTCFRHLEHTPALDVRIQEKSQHLVKYFSGNFELQWYCFAKDKKQVADVCVIGNGFKLHASAESDSLYKSFDLVVDKVETQMRKLKDKLHTRMGREKISKTGHLSLLKSNSKRSKRVKGRRGEREAA